jgi:hypothetical protein
VLCKGVLTTTVSKPFSHSVTGIDYDGRDRLMRC